MCETHNKVLKFCKFIAKISFFFFRPKIHYSQLYFEAWMQSAGCIQRNKFNWFTHFNLVHFSLVEIVLVWRWHLGTSLRLRYKINKFIKTNAAVRSLPFIQYTHSKKQYTVNLKWRSLDDVRYMTQVSKEIHWNGLTVLLNIKTDSKTL